MKTEKETNSKRLEMSPRDKVSDLQSNGRSQTCTASQDVVTDNTTWASILGFGPVQSFGCGYLTLIYLFIYFIFRLGRVDLINFFWNPNLTQIGPDSKKIAS